MHPWKPPATTVCSQACYGYGPYVVFAQRKSPLCSVPNEGKPDAKQSSSGQELDRGMWTGGTAAKPNTDRQPPLLRMYRAMHTGGGGGRGGSLNPLDTHQRQG